MEKTKIYRELKSRKWRLAFHVMKVRENHPEHTHEFPELVLVLDGQALHVINGHPVYIQKGDVFFVQQQDAHYYDVLNKLQVLNIVINPMFSFDYLKNIKNLIKELDANKRNSYLRISSNIIDGILSVMEQHVSRGQIPQTIKESCFFYILSSAASDFSGGSNTHSEHAVYSVLRYLQTDFCSDKDWHKIAANFGMSHRTFYRKFKDITGLTPNDYLYRLRLVFARKIIKETRAKISDIAKVCGFSSSVHFSRKYKEKFGLSPGEDRSQSV